MQKYRVTLKHDNGKVKITTCAASQESAINNIVNTEGCPKSAIIKVEEIKVK